MKSKGTTIRSCGVRSRNSSPGSWRRHTASATANSAAWRCTSNSKRGSPKGYKAPHSSRALPLKSATAHLPKVPTKIIPTNPRGIIGFLCKIGFTNRSFPRWEPWTSSKPGTAAEQLHLRKAIITLMARGWESKSVEAQQEEASGRTLPGKPRLTLEAAVRLREKESLRLSLQSVVQQLERSHNARHQAMLERARADLERKIQDLGA
jgi:hypothetical protein